MNEISAIAGISAPSLNTQITVSNIGSVQLADASQPVTEGFDTMLAEAIETLDGKVAEADQMVAQFAVDENTPIHQVTIALEEARMAVEFATQVRERLTEGYRQLMNMQL